MCARVRKYGFWFGLLLLAGCADEDAMGVMPGTSETSDVPIAFNCTAPCDWFSENSTRAANGYTGIITTENKQLRYAGFGVFMAHDDASIPDIMYNQKVEFVFLSDGSGNGYWTYSPLKYWPAQPIGVCLYAYAPYVPEPESLPAGTTGIIGMSANDATTPTVSYARAKHPEENVDLLWCCHVVGAGDDFIDDGRPKMSEAVSLNLRHALARVRLSLGITNGSSLGTDKLFVKRVTLTGNFAKTGVLELNHSGETPTWTSQVLATAGDPDADKTIFTDCNPSVNTNSYGIIAEAARYIDGLPVAWQPAGLPHVSYDGDDPVLKDNKTNLLCMGDALSYIYLIPQADLQFTCVLDFCRITSEGVVTDFSKTTDVGETPIHITPLNGNKTYEVVMKITL